MPASRQIAGAVLAPGARTSAPVAAMLTWRLDTCRSSAAATALHVRDVQQAPSRIRTRRHQTSAWASVSSAQPQSVMAGSAGEARLAADTALYEGDVPPQQDAAVVSIGGPAVRRPDKAR